MSMPHSRRTRIRIEFAVALAALLAVCTTAQAKQSDKNQPIHLSAAHLVGSQQNGKLVVTGDVKLDQGTFHADGDQATGYTDPNDTSQYQRVVLTGKPAHFQQTQDNGMLVHGQADTIDYKVSENTVILTGDATVVEQGRGSFHGEKLVYNTDSGMIEGNAAAGGRVHITLQPRNPAPASAPPASASSNPTGAAPHPAGSAPATPRSSGSPAPAPASTTGTY